MFPRISLTSLRRESPYFRSSRRSPTIPALHNPSLVPSTLAVRRRLSKLDVVSRLSTRDTTALEEFPRRRARRATKCSCGRE
eukprot:scaffold470_cov257-Pinguiococcus_pyrenoidosus.AAC.22